jgi:hypothetical protein
MNYREIIGPGPFGSVAVLGTVILFQDLPASDTSTEPAGRVRVMKLQKLHFKILPIIRHLCRPSTHHRTCRDIVTV